METREVSLRLDGRVALVSGGSRGIGAATVRALAGAGARVFFTWERAAAAAERLVAELGVEGCVALQADLATPAAGGAVVDTVVERCGRLDLLVANHGIWPPVDVPVDRLSDDQWRRTLSVNLDGVFGLVRATVARLKDQGDGGVLVLVASTAAQRGEAFHADYAASKGALVSITKGLATELAPHKIRVNCVAPGWVDTDMAAPAIADPVASARALAAIPLGRVGRPEEIAAPILFLCTEHAGFITGEVLNVNGGAVLVG